MADGWKQDLEKMRNEELPNDVRLPAVKRLLTQRPVEAVPALIEALNDDDWWTRAMSADILAEIGDQRAVGPLCEVIEKEKTVGGKLYGGDEESYIKALGKLGDPGFDALVALARDKDDCRRRQALLTISDDFRARSFEPAADALEDSEIKGWACRVLGWSKDARALPLLIEALDDPAKTETAATALGDLGDPGAIKALQETLKKYKKNNDSDTARTLTTVIEKLKSGI
jgi:HEAT repeat protein